LNSKYLHMSSAVSQFVHIHLQNLHRASFTCSQNHRLDRYQKAWFSVPLLLQRNTRGRDKRESKQER
jgi:hypothetical protein